MLPQFKKESILKVFSNIKILVLINNLIYLNYKIIKITQMSTKGLLCAETVT